METIAFTSIKVLSLILLAISMAFLLIATRREAPPLFASVGWHGHITG
jgi:hypothetical protein